MTETEWKELSARIAREVMCWTLVAEMADKPLWWNDQEWIKFDSDGHPTATFYTTPMTDPLSGYHIWQPYLNIAQVLRAKDTIVKRGYYFDLLDRGCNYHYAGFWRLDKGKSISEAGETEAKAICLAIREWCDDQTA